MRREKNLKKKSMCRCDSQAPQEEEEEISTSPGVSEFVSDAFDSAAIDRDDLRKEMEQLVLDKKDDVPSPDGWCPPSVSAVLSPKAPTSVCTVVHFKWRDQVQSAQSPGH